MSRHRHLLQRCLRHVDPGSHVAMGRLDAVTEELDGTMRPAPAADEWEAATGALAGLDTRSADIHARCAEASTRRGAAICAEVDSLGRYSPHAGGRLHRLSHRLVTGRSRRRRAGAACLDAAKEGPLDAPHGDDGGPDAAARFHGPVVGAAGRRGGAAHAAAGHGSDARLLWYEEALPRPGPKSLGQLLDRTRSSARSSTRWSVRSAVPGTGLPGRRRHLPDAYAEARRDEQRADRPTSRRWHGSLARGWQARTSVWSDSLHRQHRGDGCNRRGL